MTFSSRPCVAPTAYPATQVNIFNDPCFFFKPFNLNSFRDIFQVVEV